MVNVLIAGGLGDVGRILTQAIHQTGKHKIYVMTRKVKPIEHAEIVESDYSSVEDLTRQLQDLRIEVVISTMNPGYSGVQEAQANLIRAAAASGCVKGFMPSEWNIDYSVPESKMPYPPRGVFLAAVEELQRWPQLRYTLVRCGFFLDYLGLPYAETELHDIYCLVDYDHSMAVVPGDGEASVVFTHTTDVGRFTAALLGLSPDQWPVESTIIGEKIKINDLVGLAQSIAGRDFKVTHDAIETLRQNQTTEMPSNIPHYSSFAEGKEEADIIIATMMIGMAEGVFDLQGETLNDRFPDIEVIKIEPFLRECFAKAKKNG